MAAERTQFFLPEAIVNWLCTLQLLLSAIVLLQDSMSAVSKPEARCGSIHPIADKYWSDSKAEINLQIIPATERTARDPVRLVLLQ